MTRIRLCFLAALLLFALVLPRSAAAQQQDALPQQGTPPQRDALAQNPLRLATEVGRFLFAYDQAANRATTMLLSEDAGADGVRASIARQHRDGHWSVGFGHLTEAGTFQLVHEVVMNERRLIDETHVDAGRRLPSSDYYARAARAQRLARRNLDGQHGPYNLLVVPAGAEAGRLTVYAVPAQTNPDAYQLGGDYRFEVDPAAETVVNETPLHKRFYEAGALPEGIIGSAHRAARPVETDVLFAIARRPPAPHFVLAGQQVYKIAPDGSITALPAGSFTQRDEVKVLDGS